MILSEKPAAFRDHALDRVVEVCIVNKLPNIRHIGQSPCAGSGDESVISALCLRSPFLLSRFRAMRLQREKQQ
jgi:hypothetical protein